MASQNAPCSAAWGWWEFDGQEEPEGVLRRCPGKEARGHSIWGVLCTTDACQQQT